MRGTVAIMGAGLTGCAAAEMLKRHGRWEPVIYEALDEIGGNTRTAALHGARYEKCGPHIFHTGSDEIWEAVEPFVRPYRHFVKSLTPHGYLSWPPQLYEIRKLPEVWKQVEKELAARPEKLPDSNQASFEEYVIAMMGQTLYEIFIRGYTVKQWGTDPSQLSASFAPRRIDLRDDRNDTYLFRDKHQGWLDARAYLERITGGISISLGTPICKDTLPDAAGYILTCPLDYFLHAEEERSLPWRGVDFTHTFLPGPNRAQPAPVVNLPGMDSEATRKTESTWMTGYNPAGTVVTHEYPVEWRQSYPVADAAGANRQLQRELEAEVETIIPNVVIAGRLGKYLYIDMDQAIRQGWNAALKMIRELEK